MEKMRNAFLGLGRARVSNIPRRHKVTSVHI